MGKKERVILIQGDESKWYEQAIFIVNQEAEEMPVDFVAEAEKLINTYISKNNSHKTHTDIGIAYSSVPTITTKTTKPSRLFKGTRFLKTRLFDYILNAIMAIGCIIIAAALMWGLFG